MKALEGVYRIDANTTRTLRLVDGRLTAQRTGGPRAKLVPIGKDEFLYEDGFNRFRIERDGAGKATGMRMFHEGEGEGVVSALTGDPLPGERASVKLPRAALERVAGRYSYGGMAMRLFVEGEQLKGQLGAQPVVELFAESPNRFFLTIVDATLEFAPAEGAPQSLTLYQGPATIEFKRDAE